MFFRIEGFAVIIGLLLVFFLNCFGVVLGEVVDGLEDSLNMNGKGFAVTISSLKNF